MKTILYALLFFILTQATVHAQPGIVWERVYFNGYVSFFNDVHETSDGGFVVALYGSISPATILAKFDTDGNITWSTGLGITNQSGWWVEELSSGGYIVTGSGRETSGSSVGVLLARFDADGNEMWWKIHNVDGGSEGGRCVLPLPDGGYAVCGHKNPVSGMDQAWILRTDANGDTLWTREWGWDYNDEAKRIIFEDGGLTVLTHGRLETTSGGPHIVRYDLDGNLLWETPIPDMYGDHGQDMCTASDSGYIVLTDSSPWIAHVDSSGTTQWIMTPMGIGSKNAFSINPTMDGGYIYAGQNLPYEPEQDEISGMLVKLDSEGNQQWWDFVYESDCDGLFSARQLSQGGYIAAGIANGTSTGQGFLIRYEPEVGIEGGAGLLGVVRLDVSPNPFSSSLSISYSLPEPGQVELSVYDLSGRVIENLESGSISAGENTSAWNPDPSLPAGCYLIVLDACGERSARRCVKL